MEMTVGRNEPCPCGSGKKYKKCCMNKKQVTDINQAREERVAQQKHQLTKKLQAFMDKKVTYSEFLTLQSEFHRRSNRLVPERIEEGYVNFWLNFFYAHENGLTGVKWFLKEEGHRLQSAEKELAEQWTTLKPRLVQAVDQLEQEIVFKDLYTEETFKMTRDTENLPTFRPWYGTVGLIEFFGETPFFNGIRILQGPDHVERAKIAIDGLMAEQKVSHEEAMTQYFPEVLGALLAKEQRPFAMTQRKTIQMTIGADVEQTQAFATLLKDRDEFVVYDWRDQQKHLTQAENWATYKDSAVDSEVLMADAVAALEFSGTHMTYTTYTEEKVEWFKQLLEDYPQFVKSYKESASSHPVGAMAFSNKLLQMTGEPPEYFALYAEQAKSFDLSAPIPALDQHSIYELVDNNQMDAAESWFRQSEFNLYDKVITKYQTVDITFDINHFRKEVGLPESPFVTQKENRDSSLKPIYYHNNQFLSVKQEDIETYEDLGFSPNTVDAFYHDPILHFFKEKTDGKAAGTVRKYRTSLFTIRYSLEVQRTKNWSDCTKDFWRKHLLIDLFENDVISQTQVKDLLSTIKAFTKWLDQNTGTAIHADAAAVCSELESSLIEAVQVYNLSSDSGRFSLPQYQKVDPKATGGLFKVTEVTEDRVHVKSMDTKETVTFSLPKKAQKLVNEGLILEAVVDEDENQETVLAKLLNVYPKEAFQYL